MTLPLLSRDAFFSRKLALYLLDGLDLRSARDMAAIVTATVYSDLVDQAEYEKDWQEEREGGWSIP